MIVALLDCELKIVPINRLMTINAKVSQYRSFKQSKVNPRASKIYWKIYNYPREYYNCIEVRQ